LPLPCPYEQGKGKEAAYALNGKGQRRLQLMRKKARFLRYSKNSLAGLACPRAKGKKQVASLSMAYPKGLLPAKQGSSPLG